MIWIRADANSEIGSGHLMRCLSVADRIREAGREVAFLIADEAPVDFLKKWGMPYHILGTNYREMDAELPKLMPYMEEVKKPVVLVDSYFVTASYLTELRKHAFVVYMDDKNSYPYPVDALINYNIYGDLLSYGGRGWLADTRFLLGTEYVPLRREFSEMAARISEKTEVKNVLITTGGSDKYMLSKGFLDTFLADEELKTLHYHVVCGAFHTDVEGMREKYGALPNVTIYHNVQRMSELMKECDLAITAAGSTMYELSALGLPICSFSFVDNQEQILDTFVNKNLVVYGGNYLELGEELFAQTAKSLKAFLKEKKLYKEHSDKLKKLVDGQGAVRIAQFLCRMES